MGNVYLSKSLNIESNVYWVDEGFSIDFDTNSRQIDF